MPRWMRVASACFLVLCASACAPSNPGIAIAGMVVPSNTCTFAVTNSVFLLNPRLDTALPPFVDGLPVTRDHITYDATFQVENRILRRFNRIYPVMADPSNFLVEGADVEITALDGSALPELAGLPNPFRVTAVPVLVPAAIQETQGRAIARIQVIPAVYGDSLVGIDGTLLVAVRIFGTTTGGSTQQTQEYVFPLELCNNCLFTLDDVSAMCVEETACSPGQNQRTVFCP